MSSSVPPSTPGPQEPPTDGFTPLQVENSGSADYVLRTAQQEILAISALADQKANILLGVSLIMATAVVGLLPSSGLTVGLVVLGISTVGAAVLALLSLLPSKPVALQTPNPLYFVDVGSLPFDDYRKLMANVLAESPTVYHAILADLHQSSQFLLASKFRYLRAAYLAFLVGLGLTVIGVGIDIARGTIS